MDPYWFKKAWNFSSSNSAMAISLCFSPLTSTTPKHYSRIPLYKPITTLTTPKILNPNFKKVKCVPDHPQNLSVIQEKPRWANWLSTAESLYPVYITVGGVVACLKPSTFSWFVKCSPTSYSLTLWFIMLAMGLTLEIKELTNLLLQRPLSVSTLNFFLKKIHPFSVVWFVLDILICT